LGWNLSQPTASQCCLYSSTSMQQMPRHRALARASAVPMQTVVSEIEAES